MNWSAAVCFLLVVPFAACVDAQETKTPLDATIRSGIARYTFDLPATTGGTVWSVPIRVHQPEAAISVNVTVDWDLPLDLILVRESDVEIFRFGLWWPYPSVGTTTVGPLPQVPQDLQATGPWRSPFGTAITGTGDYRLLYGHELRADDTLELSLLNATVTQTPSIFPGNYLFVGDWTAANGAGEFSVSQGPGRVSETGTLKTEGTTTVFAAMGVAPGTSSLRLSGPDDGTWTVQSTNTTGNRLLVTGTLGPGDWNYALEGAWARGLFFLSIVKDPQGPSTTFAMDTSD